MISAAESFNEFVDKQVPIQENFVIDSDDRANWALGKIAQYQKAIQEANDFYADQKSKLDEWLEEATRENKSQIEYFESMLLPYADKKLDGSKKRSFKLPKGTIGFRKGTVKYFMDGQTISGSDEKLTKWAKLNAPDYIKVKESTDWAELKKELVVSKSGKVLASDGQIIPGMEATQSPDTFYAKVGDK